MKYIKHECPDCRDSFYNNSISTRPCTYCGTEMTVVCLEPEENQSDTYNSGVEQSGSSPVS